ncbi:MAG: MAPEG family protein [Rhodospirillaceae bacterium]|nr:MAPEG family protein [Rhodospirillaceae bacterium]
MPSPLPLPVTLITASILALIALVLALRVSFGRFRHRVPIGEGGNTHMTVLIRTHANFVEYVPLILILMGILEMSKANRIALLIVAVLLIIFRIFHVIGMPRRAPNFFRATGAIGTMVTMGVLAVWGLVLAFTA